MSKRPIRIHLQTISVHSITIERGYPDASRSYALYHLSRASRARLARVMEPLRMHIDGGGDASITWQTAGYACIDESNEPAFCANCCEPLAGHGLFCQRCIDAGELTYPDEGHDPCRREINARRWNTRHNQKSAMCPLCGEIGLEIDPDGAWCAACETYIDAAYLAELYGEEEPDLED